jgi:hypothetical protein
MMIIAAFIFAKIGSKRVIGGFTSFCFVYFWRRQAGILFYHQGD